MEERKSGSIHASCKYKRSLGEINNPKLTIRDATKEDIDCLKFRTKYRANKFFGTIDLMIKHILTAYSLVVLNYGDKILAYAHFENFPNIRAISKTCWLYWMHNVYRMEDVTYGNTLFMTFFLTEDAYNPDIIKNIFTEIFLREQKLKYICTVVPPIDSVYQDILEPHCTRHFAFDESINTLRQSIFLCERYTLLPKMRLRRAISEDNDDLVEIIDEKLKVIRLELGDYYISEQVLRNDPSENIVVAEISHVTVGMVWINTNIHRKALTDNFETGPFRHFLQPRKDQQKTVDRVVVGISRKDPEMFYHEPEFSKLEADPLQNILFDLSRSSTNNLYICDSSNSSELSSEESEVPPTLFEKWQRIGKNLRSELHYVKEAQSIVKTPSTSEATNAFAIQLFGLTSTIDRRRIFDLIAATFASYPDKDYCLISLSSSEASSDSYSGALLRYFSRVAPRPGCKISDCLYVTHRNSFLTEIEVNKFTRNDTADVETILCLDRFQGMEIYFVADLLNGMTEYLENPYSTRDILVMRSAGCAIGFVMLRQNTSMCEFRTNYIAYDLEYAFPDWKTGELLTLYLHPAFIWEWRHVTREIFRMTGYNSMYFKLIRKYGRPIQNSILMNMFPLFPRKRLHGMYTITEPYALYSVDMKLCHLVRDQIENKIVIVGFNETCKGFLRTLLYSQHSKHIQCLNITVITDYPGIIEAEYDNNTFAKNPSMFFNAKNQFNADNLRRLEFRTWVAFIGGKLKGIRGSKKRIVLENGTNIRYDRLYLMTTAKFHAPKRIYLAPLNYIEVNSRLDKIIFYHKIRTLADELHLNTLPIVIYGSVVLAHSCVNALIDLNIPGKQICLVIPMMKGKINFPETFDDDYVTSMIYKMEMQAGVTIYKNLQFIDWILNPDDNSIKNVLFESDFERVGINCLAFVSFHGEEAAENVNVSLDGQSLRTVGDRIIIDEKSRTNIPFVYACGKRTQFEDKLFAKQMEQGYYNQIEVGNQLAMSFIKERHIGEPSSMLENYMKPIFRQFELIDGLLYGGLREPGRYVPRGIRKNLHGYGKDLVTSDNTGEYCRVSIDKNGFVKEITCLTRKYKCVEILYRIYNLHENILNNMKVRCETGDIKNLLDFFYSQAFQVIFHDQFRTLRETIRQKNLECLKEIIEDKRKYDKEEIIKILKDKGMEEFMQGELIEFITVHWKSLRPHYAIPEDFENT